MKTFEQLFEELKNKVKDAAKDLSQSKSSFTLKAIEKGEHFIGKKIVEEAAEVWMAAEYQSKEELAKEISQLLYHIQVLMIKKKLSLEEVYKFL